MQGKKEFEDSVCRGRRLKVVIYRIYRRFKLVFHKIDFASLKMSSFDQETFLKDSVSYSENSILYFFDFEKITLEHKPGWLKWLPKTIHFFFPKNSILRNRFKLLWWSIFIGQFYSYLASFVFFIVPGFAGQKSHRLAGCLELQKNQAFASNLYIALEIGQQIKKKGGFLAGLLMILYGYKQIILR